ncbi:hypothetical protein [Mycobacterium sp.]|uniref:hypothetical protein n=1 Tax=Mycobacterium sp. TaxID=1785 RepID=UPI003C73AD93
MIPDSHVAWLLSDAASPCLNGAERTMAFVELGCGDNHLAITRILAVVVRERFPLPAALLATLTGWLDLYVGTEEERRIRALVARVRPLAAAKPSPEYIAVPKHTEPGHSGCNVGDDLEDRGAP